MYKNKKTICTTLEDKTVYGAINFVRSGKINTKNLVYQVGSNDLETKSPDEVMKEIERLVRETKEALPSVKIVMCELLPRYYNNGQKSAEFNEKRCMFNVLLKDFCSDSNIDYVEFFNMKINCFYDGIHLTSNGVGQYVKCLKEILNPILGMKVYETPSQGYMYTHSKIHVQGQNKMKTQGNGDQGYRNTSSSPETHMYQPHFNESGRSQSPFYYNRGDYTQFKPSYMYEKGDHRKSAPHLSQNNYANKDEIFSMLEYIMRNM